MTIELPETILGFPLHPVARAMPSYSDEAFEEFKNNIELLGQRVPIILWNNRILDGAHRAYAVEQIGGIPIFNEFDGTEIGAIEEGLVHNVYRRHLTTAQKALAVVAHEKLIKEFREKFAAEHKSRPRPKTKNQLARDFGTTGRSVQKGRNVILFGTPQLQKATFDGKIGLDAAQRIALAPIETQDTLLGEFLTSATLSEHDEDWRRNDPDVLSQFMKKHLLGPISKFRDTNLADIDENQYAELYDVSEDLYYGLRAASEVIGLALDEFRKTLSAVPSLDYIVMEAECSSMHMGPMGLKAKHDSIM